jgi:WhiB family redox-sensing transcriptional regulator
MPRANYTLAPLDGDTSPQWQLKGACRDYDPDLFHPETEAQAQEPKKICWRCPVRVECLSWAMEGNMTGVWGATTHRQRERLRWRRARTYCPVCASSLVIDERAGPRKGQVCVACGTSWTS